MSGRLLIVLVVASVMVASPGCEQAPARPSAVFPVDGQLLFQGKPAVGAVVAFHRRPGASTDEMHEAVVRQDGHFVAVQPDGAIGLPPGEYSLTVRWNDGERDRFEGRHANPDAPVSKITVTEGINLLPPISLP